MRELIHNNQKVLDYTWFNNWQGSIGLIKCEDVITKEIKFFLGNGGEFGHLETDLKIIIDKGSKVYPEHLINFLSK